LAVKKIEQTRRCGRFFWSHSLRNDLHCMATEKVADKLYSLSHFPERPG